MERPTFTHQSGAICRWSPDGADLDFLDARQVEALRAEFSTEARAAFRAGKRDESARLAGLWMQLTTAQDELAAYQRGATLGLRVDPNGHAITFGAEPVVVVPTFDAARAVMAAAREAPAQLAACLAMAPGRGAA